MGIKARIGLFGGSFNPVHKGHLRVAEEVKEKLKLDGVVFIPAAIPYHRAIEGTTPAQRYRMSLDHGAPVAAQPMSAGKTPARAPGTELKAVRGLSSSV